MGRDVACSVKSLLAPFNESKTLLGKPKIFFFDVCRGDRDENAFSETKTESKAKKRFSETNHSDSQKMSIDLDDFLFGWACIEGYKAKISSNGSWYTAVLCETLNKYSKNTELIDMMRLVHKKVKNRHQITTEYTCRIGKKCYFSHWSSSLSCHLFSWFL